MCHRIPKRIRIRVESLKSLKVYKIYVKPRKRQHSKRHRVFLYHDQWYFDRGRGDSSLFILRRTCPLREYYGVHKVYSEKDRYLHVYEVKEDLTLLTCDRYFDTRYNYSTAKQLCEKDKIDGWHMKNERGNMKKDAGGLLMPWKDAKYDTGLLNKTKLQRIAKSKFPKDALKAAVGYEIEEGKLKLKTVSEDVEYIVSTKEGTQRDVNIVSAETFVWSDFKCENIIVDAIHVGKDSFWGNEKTERVTFSDRVETMGAGV